MREILGGEIRVVDVPTKLLFVPLAFQFKIEVDWDQYLLLFFELFLSHNVERIGSEDKLLIDSFIESSVPGPSRVQAIEPLG
jgi:hypothetical protein